MDMSVFTPAGRILQEKRGGCVTVCRLSAYWGVCLLAIAFNTKMIDARIIKFICIMPLCIQILATYLAFLSVFLF